MLFLGDTIDIAKEIYRRWRHMVKSPEDIKEFHMKDETKRRTIEQIISIKIEPDYRPRESSDWMLTGPFLAVTFTNFFIILIMLRFLFKRFMKI